MMMDFERERKRRQLWPEILKAIGEYRSLMDDGETLATSSPGWSLELRGGDGEPEQCHQD